MTHYIHHCPEEGFISDDFICPASALHSFSRLAGVVGGGGGEDVCLPAVDFLTFEHFHTKAAPESNNENIDEVCL